MRGLVISLMILDARETLNMNSFTWENSGPCEMHETPELV